jgi:hypothetical protein
MGHVALPPAREVMSQVCRHSSWKMWEQVVMRRIEVGSMLGVVGEGVVAVLDSEVGSGSASWDMGQVEDVPVKCVFGSGEVQAEKKMGMWG